MGALFNLLPEIGDKKSYSCGCIIKRVNEYKFQMLASCAKHHTDLVIGFAKACKAFCGELDR